MTERPILFSAPMIRALLAGTKTQTRRVCKNQPYPNGYKFDGRDFLCHNDYLPPSAMLMDGGRGKLRWTTSDVEGWESECPYGLVGDQLWVREAFYFIGESGETFFRATGDSDKVPPMSWGGPWKPSIHMPRRCSRIQLEVSGVRVERLQDISEEDAKAEGAKCAAETTADDDRLRAECGYFPPSSYAHGYRLLWESINGTGSWATNPWVWVVEFRRIRP